jgi:hypothetical protein
MQRAVELLGADVEMDDARTRRRHRVALGGDLAQLAADDQQQVGLADDVVGDPIVAAEQAGTEGIDARNSALACHGVRDRNVEGAREGGQRVRSTRQVHATAGQDQRTLRCFQHFRRPPQRSRIGTAAQCGDRHMDLARLPGVGGEAMHAMGNVFRHVEHHRPRSSRCCDGECAPDQLRNPRQRLDPDDLLDRRPQDLQLPALLGHVLP